MVMHMPLPCVKGKGEWDYWRKGGLHTFCGISQLLFRTPAAGARGTRQVIWL